MTVLLTQYILPSPGMMPSV